MPLTQASATTTRTTARGHEPLHSLVWRAMAIGRRLRVLTWSLMARQAVSSGSGTSPQWTVRDQAVDPLQRTVGRRSACHQPEWLEHAADLVGDIPAHAHQLRAAANSQPTWWLSQPVTAASRYQPVCTICARSRASLQSDLFNCTDRAALHGVHPGTSPATRPAAARGQCSVDSRQLSDPRPSPGEPRRGSPCHPGASNPPARLAQPAFRPALQPLARKLTERARLLLTKRIQQKQFTSRRVSGLMGGENSIDQGSPGREDTTI
jgi:hypothetical protein